ncbi:FISUMP domain-containing protein [Sphingobacterium sp.]|uniref:FISUMP domain-containing protein n=1 Tax=Sphingobacterium sp. TaxID=341027 RepID=UPI0025856AC9|nr:FISUMP domain-containing protein [Sphingobacterium sp.]WET68600.1 MAG: FISUMP domain-containing protein [Sphingobacterium sp.]
MKKKSINKNSILLATLSACLFLFSTITSCSKEPNTKIDTENGDLANINVIFKASIYENEGTLGTKSSTGKSNSTPKSLPIQTNTIELNNDFLLVAELAPAENSSSPAKVAVASNKKAVVENNNVDADIRYKIVVYNETGKYILEKDYVHGKESLADAFQLPSGKTYSFIAYSVNSTTELPSINFSDIANKTLSTSNISVAGEQDFMYFRKDMSVSATSQNNLEIILKHLFSQITTSIDATQTKYDITHVSSSIAISHQPNAAINLSTGAVSRSGSGTDISLTFPTTGGMLLTSLSNIINAEASNNVALKIASITIGPLTQTNVIPFSSLNITPGVKYDMKLKIVPTDEYLTHRGVPAVRINGNIWMQHNLGADISIDPAQTPQTVSLFGDYYQWGQNTVVAGKTESYPNSNWSSITDLPVNSWNLGTENNPIKASGDPCPSGYRVPTKTEMEKLINSTVASEKGTWLPDENNFTAAKILTSKRRRDVVIYFPIQGGYGYGTGGANGITPTNLIFRGVIGLYWLSTADASSRVSHVYFTNTGISPMFGGSNYDQQATSENIRCIAQ